MRFDGNFRNYGRLDAAALRGCIELQSADAWLADQFRQKNFPVHTDTQTIYLIYDQDFRHSSPTKTPLFEEFSGALRPFIDLISEPLEPGGWVARCMFAKLCSGGQIRSHEDHGLSLAHARRFHIPVITNADATFTVGGESIHMKAGDIWEINNTRRHGAENRGSEPRVHLILDWAQPLTSVDFRAHLLERQARRSKREH